MLVSSGLPVIEQPISSEEGDGVVGQGEEGDGVVGQGQEGVRGAEEIGDFDDASEVQCEVGGDLASAKSLAKRRYSKRLATLENACQKFYDSDMAEW